MKEGMRRKVDGLLGGLPRRWEGGLVLLVYGLLAVVMTWPAAARLGTHLVGGGDDTILNQWIFWWVKRCIALGENPFYTDLLFYPVGVSQTVQNIAWLNIALWLPLQGIVGGSAAYSLVMMGVYALNGFAMYLLARDWTRSVPAAFVAGLIFGFWPYTLSSSEHPNLIFVAWVPLAFLYLHRTLGTGRKRDAALTGFFVALIGVTSWHLLVIGGLGLGLYVLYRCLTERGCRTRRTAGLLALVGLVAAMLLVPLLMPMVAYQLTRPSPQDILVDEANRGHTDLLAYALPSRARPAWRDIAGSLYENLADDKVLRVPFLGYTALALALYGTVKRWRSARFWLLAALVYMALALGPELVVNGRVYPQVPMPGQLLEGLSLMRIVRWPHRFNFLLGLAVGMLAALGMTALLGRRPARWRATLLTVLVGGLVVFEYWSVPFPLESPIVPGWYRELAKEPGQFGILDLPMHPRQQRRDKWYMLYQITHGKALVEGHVSRIPQEAYAFLDSTPYLKELHEENVMDPGLMDVTHQLQPLVEAGVRYIILHKRTATPDELAAWQDWLAYEPYYEDEELVVYRTEPRMGEDTAVADEMTAEIGLMRADVTIEGEGRPGSGSIEVEARWGARGRPGRDYDVCVELVGVGEQVAQVSCEPLSPAWPTSRWEAGEVVRSRQAVQVDPFAETGVYTVTLVLADAVTGGEVGVAKGLGMVEAEGLPRVFAEPRPSQEVRAEFGESVLLHGYDLQMSADSLEMMLYWQAKERMDVSYKVFVYVVDGATGEVVAQHDAVPREWSYPTSWWEEGEVGEERVVLSLEGIGAGDYALWVGLYDAETGVRLPVYAADGEQVVGDAVLLTAVER